MTRPERITALKQIVQAGEGDTPQGKARFRVRHQYDEVEDANAELETMTFNDEPSKTQQQYTEEMDINFMVARMGIDDGSTIPPFFHQSVTGDRFGDFTDAPDFRTAMDRLKEATDAFNELPARIRREFNNDPAELMRAVEDETQHEHLVELGILNKLPPKLPDGVANRRELARWVKENQQEAIDLGYAEAVEPPNPKPAPLAKLKAPTTEN